MKKEEKAEEYSKARYVNYIEQYNVLDKIDLERFSKEDFLAGADYIQHLNRWRKVEEELPEDMNDNKSNQVLIKTKHGYYDVAVYNERYGDFTANSISISGVTEWKPIN